MIVLIGGQEILYGGQSIDYSIDSVSPTITLSSAQAGSVYTFTASASDNVGVAGVQFFINGLPFGADDQLSPFAWQWNTAGQLDGIYNIVAQARDAAGNSQLSNTLQIILSNGVVPQAGSPLGRRGRGVWEQKNSIWQQIETQ